MTYKAAVVIPCFNHARPLEGVLRALRPLGLPIFLVDDGSRKEEADLIDVTLKEFPEVTLVRRKVNGGKGAAVIDGALAAEASGFTHILQIDSDGQHDITDAAKLLSLSKENPSALISGFPIYDKSVPKGRLAGRYITHFWVWLETLSSTIVDSMCGFRVYPLEALLRIVRRENLGRHMDFDPEILVRLYWDAVPMRFIPTRVIYPEGGTSNFDAVKDNWRISKMHAKLFCRSIPMWPKLIRRERSAHWSELEERRGLLGMQFLLALYRLFGRRVFNVALLAPLLVFRLVAKDAVKASDAYLNRIKTIYAAKGIEPHEPLTVFRHFKHFADSILDKFASWTEGTSDDLPLRFEDEETKSILTQKAGDSGKILFVSHLGCAEVCRAVAENDYEVPVNALVFEKHAPRYKALMEKVAPRSHIHLIAVDTIGVETAVELKEKLDRGEWVAIAADRTPVRSDGKIERSVSVSLLGEAAPFPIGPYVLASLLKAPVCVLFANRSGNVISVKAHLFSEEVTLRRATRRRDILSYASEFACLLEERTLKYPLDWFNFFNFWQREEKDTRNPKFDGVKNGHE